MLIQAEERVRIDKYLINKLSFSRSKVQRMIEGDAILVNGNSVKNSYLLRVGDEIEIFDDYQEEVDIVPENIFLDIVLLVG